MSGCDWAERARFGVRDKLGTSGNKDFRRAFSRASDIRTGDAFASFSDNSPNYGIRCWLHVGDGRCNTAYGESGKYDHEAQNERWQQRLFPWKLGRVKTTLPILVRMDVSSQDKPKKNNALGLYEPGCVLHTRYLIQ